MSPSLQRSLSFLCAFLILIGSCKKTGSSAPGNPGDPGNPDGNPAVTTIGTPVGSPVTKTIGAAGGSIASADGRVLLTIPAGALSANTPISIQAVTNQCPGGIGVAYDFLPNGTKFATPALLRFNYADSDVNGTDPYLLYLAFQDSAHIWRQIDSDKDIDTVAKTASFDISHFTEMAVKPYIQIDASKSEYNEGESGTLTINKWAPFGATDDGPIFAAFPVPSGKLSKWSLNGDGSIQSNGSSATYKAPADIPKDKTVQVSIVVQDTKTVRLRAGKIITFTNKTYSVTLKLLSTIVIFDISLDFKFTGFSGIYNDVYTDHATLAIQTNTKGIEVKNLGIHNDPCQVTPASGSNGVQSATWIPDGTGLMNIASVEGFFYIVPLGDSIWLDLTHIGTKTPKFEVVDQFGDVIDGGVPVPGYPPYLVFGNYRDHVQVIQVGYFVTATITPRKQQ